MGDYESDNRGDVGSWVREAAITRTPALLSLAIAHNEPSTAESAVERAALDAALPTLCERFACALSQQVNEKIDRMREHAARALAQMLATALPRVRGHAQLSELFPPLAPPPSALRGATKPEGGPSMEETPAHTDEETTPPTDEVGSAVRGGDGAAAAGDGAAAAGDGAAARGAAPSGRRADGSFTHLLTPASCFPITVRLLSVPLVRKPALRGLAVSVGGLTESTLRAASHALLKHACGLAPALLEVLSADLLALLEEHGAQPRLSLPLMRTFTRLVEGRALERVLAPEDAAAKGGPTEPKGGPTEPKGGPTETGGIRACAPRAADASRTPLAARVRTAVAVATRGTREMATLIVSLELQVLLLPYARDRFLAEALRSVLLFLGHRYPKLRKMAADLLYVSLTHPICPHLPHLILTHLSHPVFPIRHTPLCV